MKVARCAQIISVLPFTLFACAPNVDSSSSMGKNTNPQVLNLLRAPTEASTLQVTDLQMSKINIKGVNMGSLYIAASGLSDFVEISTCSSKGCDATRKETSNKFVFAPFSSENISIKVRACVDPQRAVTPGVLCGTWKEISWTQPPNNNSELTELLSEREKYRSDIEDMGSRIKEALESFQQELGHCDEPAAAVQNIQNIQNIRNIVGNFVNLGELLISKAISPGNIGTDGRTPALGKSSGETIVPDVDIKSVINKTAESAAKIEASTLPESKVALSNVQKAAQQASGQNNIQYGLTSNTDPIGGLRGLADAVINIATASEQSEALRPCFAKSNAESLISVAQARLIETRKKLTDVEEEILKSGRAN